MTVMKITILKETALHEKRVAASPETVKKMVEMGARVYVEKGAGLASSVSDEEYAQAGATLSAIPLELIADADIVLKVQPSLEQSEEALTELSLMRSGAVLVGLLSPFENRELIGKYAEKGITAFSMELIPRITRAQSMDVLSSQSNLAGYKAALDAMAAYGRAIPMMMTAAGTIAAAKVLVLGAGVAGLQAIATAKRLGAIVSAFDVRPVAREQVESLGASFVEVASTEESSAETKGGYAREMSEEYKRKQQELIAETVKKQDIVIATALIPGKPAPLLLTEAMVMSMRKGSVIVDLAAPAGGNCAFTEKDQVITKHGVTIIGHTNTASRIASDASRFYARNVLNFIATLVNKETHSLVINREDEIIKGALLTYEGKIVNPWLNPN